MTFLILAVASFGYAAAVHFLLKKRPTAKSI
jgi:hypothetical protein